MEDQTATSNQDSSTPDHPSVSHPSRRRMTPFRRLLYVLTAPVLVALVRSTWWTCRFDVRGDRALHELAAAGRPMVLAFWHENLFLMSWYMSRLSKIGVGVTYLVSPSLDGDYAVKLLDVIETRAVRGSATRSGARAIRGLYRVIVKDRGSPVVAADGPRGPRRRCKPGAVILGQLAGAPVVPLACTPKWAFHLRSWDRMSVPVPFTRVAVEVGEPMEIPKRLTKDEFEAHRTELESRINTLAVRAAERVGLTAGV